MWQINEQDDADSLWAKAWLDLRTEGLTHHNTARGGSSQILHYAMSLSDPRQRWVANRVPAINPAFAVAEVVWIMRARRDSAFLVAWNNQLPQYAGRSEKMHGAYGYRLRRKFGIDQLKRAAEALAGRPDTRQITLSLWSPAEDLPNADGSPVDGDVPCNAMAMLKIVEGRLDWLQVMRSNDVVRGLPYNLVQWTTLQEVLAGWLGCELGSYNHLSDSLHLYDEDVANFSARGNSPLSVNTDDLRLPYGESERVFKEIEETIEWLVHADDPKRIQSRHSDGVPEAYRAMLDVMRMERLRRLKALPEARYIAGNIGNPSLKEVSMKWLDRFSEMAS